MICEASFASPTTVAIEAVPEVNYLFAGWSGDCLGGRSVDVRVHSATRCSADFQLEHPDEPRTVMTVDSEPGDSIGQGRNQIFSPANSRWSVTPIEGRRGLAIQLRAVGAIQDSYERAVGEIDLDLSGVDFEGRDVAVTLRIDLGSIVVTLPPDVDVVVDAAVDIGSAQVLGQSWDGFGNGSRTVEDLGRDGKGGGTLHITASVGIGNLEIER